MVNIIRQIEINFGIPFGLNPMQVIQKTTTTVTPGQVLVYQQRRPHRGSIYCCCHARWHLLTMAILILIFECINVIYTATSIFEIFNLDIGITTAFAILSIIFDVIAIVGSCFAIMGTKKPQDDRGRAYVILFIGISILNLVVELVIATLAQYLYAQINGGGYNLFFELSYEIWFAYGSTFYFLVNGIIAAVLYLKDFLKPTAITYPPCCCCGKCM